MRHQDHPTLSLLGLIVAAVALTALVALPGCNVSNCCSCTCEDDDCWAEIDVSSSELMNCESECQTQCALNGCSYDSGEPCD